MSSINERNQIWHLVPGPHDRPIICTKWIFKNKLDELENVIRNKGRLVAQGYAQIEDIDFEKTFGTAWSHTDDTCFCFIQRFFKPFQMDAKSVFLNGFIEEEVYVEQPLGLLILHIRILFSNYTKHVAKSTPFVPIFLYLYTSIVHPISNMGLNTFSYL